MTRRASSFASTRTRCSKPPSGTELTSKSVGSNFKRSSLRSVTSYMIAGSRGDCRFGSSQPLNSTWAASFGTQTVLSSFLRPNSAARNDSRCPWKSLGPDGLEDSPATAFPPTSAC